MLAELFMDTSPNVADNNGSDQFIIGNEVNKSVHLLASSSKQIN